MILILFGIKGCFCPKRLAAGTVSTLIGQLKSIFDDMGRKGEWIDCGAVKYGNPVSSSLVSRYLEAIKLEQSQAHVPIKQAKPLFFDKLQKISKLIDQKLKQKDQSPSQIFIYLRDQSFFKLQFFAGDRAHDLSLCLAQEVRQLPNDNGLVFCHTVGKTLGNGKVNEFVIAPVDDKLLCPVEGLFKYVNGAQSMGLDLRQGYLFRALDSSRKKVLDSHVSSSGMNTRLQTYLKELGIFEGETVHGIRGGCAITLVATGVASSSEVMDHVGWRDKAMFDRYSRLNKLVDATAVSSLYAQVANKNELDVNKIFKRFGDPLHLPLAFV